VSCCILDCVCEQFLGIIRRPATVGRNLVFLVSLIFLEFHGASLEILGGPAEANNGKLDGAEAGTHVNSCLSSQSCQNTPLKFWKFSKWRYSKAMETLEVAPVVHILRRFGGHPIEVLLLGVEHETVEGIHPGRAGNMCDIWHGWNRFRVFFASFYKGSLYL